MYSFFDDDEYETVFTSRPCTSCDGNLKKCNGACNGSFSLGSRRRAPDEIRKIKNRKRVEHEENILREADAIRRRRTLLAD